MKARLANKICSTPIDRLSNYWWKACMGGREERVKAAMRMVNKQRNAK